MPYSNVSEAPPQWHSLARTAGGATKHPLTLEQINYIARVYDSLVEGGMPKNRAAAAAIQAFRSHYKVVDGKWVRKALESEYDVIVSEDNTDVPFDAPFSISKYWAEDSKADDEEPEEKWYIEGRAVIDKMDYQSDVVSPIAMKHALPDLEINSTVLYNHHLDEEVGKIIAYKFDGEAIYIKVLVTKTRPDIWQKIKEGVLRKFSIRGRVISFDIRYVPQLDTIIRYIKAMHINEISVVTVSGQAEVDFKWYVEKKDEPLSYHIQKAFQHSLKGGDKQMKKARKQTPEAPLFNIAKNKDGAQVISIQVPEGFEENAADMDLEAIEKAIQSANANIGSILQAVKSVPEDASEAVKILFGKIEEAATALKKSGGDDDTVADDDADDDDVTKKADDKKSSNTVQIVLPATSQDEPVELTKELLSDPNFQEALLTHTQKGLSMQEATKKAAEDVVKAREAAANDPTGLVKTLMEHLVKKDQGLEAVNAAVIKMAELMSGYGAQIDALKKAVDTIPVRKGVTLSEEQVTTEREKIQKSIEGKEPREQLLSVLGYALGNQDSQTA